MLFMDLFSVEFQNGLSNALYVCQIVRRVAEFDVYYRCQHIKWKTICRDLLNYSEHFLRLSFVTAASRSTTLSVSTSGLDCSFSSWSQWRSSMSWWFVAFSATNVPLLPLRQSCALDMPTPCIELIRNITVHVVWYVNLSMILCCT